MTAVEHPAADRASAYGLEPILVDGNDADVMYETARQTIDKARSGGGPSLVEALTYRHGGHSRADPAKYRPDTEVREWLSFPIDDDAVRDVLGLPRYIRPIGIICIGYCAERPEKLPRLPRERIIHYEKWTQ